MDRSLKNNFLSTKSTVFMDGNHSAPNERPVSEGVADGHKKATPKSGCYYMFAR